MSKVTRIERYEVAIWQTKEGWWKWRIDIAGEGFYAAGEHRSRADAVHEAGHYVLTAVPAERLPRGS